MIIPTNSSMIKKMIARILAMISFSGEQNGRIYFPVGFIFPNNTVIHHTVKQAWGLSREGVVTIPCLSRG